MSAPHSIGRIEVRRRHGVVDDRAGCRARGRPSRRPRCRTRRSSGSASTSPKNALVLSWIAAAPRVEIVRVVDERDLDPHLRQRVVEQVVRAAVERRRGDDVVAGLAQRHERERRGRLTRRDGEGARNADRGGAPALERVEPRLERTLRRVHDAGVDVADLGEPEQVGGVLGVAELERRGLVDRHRTRAGGRIGLAADVDLLGLETPVVTHGRQH